MDSSYSYRKILILGDHGVGKTTLVSLLANPASRTSAQEWTTGCNVEVKDMETPSGTVYLQFWDIGGRPQQKIARSVFYDDADGIIFVYGLDNLKSRKNLLQWVGELPPTLRPPSWSSGSKSPVSVSEDYAEFPVPCLRVGNKADLSSKPLEEGKEGFDEEGPYRISCHAGKLRESTPGKLEGFLLKVATQPRAMFKGLEQRGDGITTHYPDSHKREMKRRSGIHGE